MIASNYCTVARTVSARQLTLLLLMLCFCLADCSRLGAEVAAKPAMADGQLAGAFYLHLSPILHPAGAGESNDHSFPFQSRVACYPVSLAWSWLAFAGFAVSLSG